MSVITLRDYSPDEIEEAFMNAFETTLRYHYLTTCEIVVPPDTEGGAVVVKIEVSAMADSPTMDEYEDNDDFQGVQVEMLDGKTVKFALDEVLFINSSEYHAFYKPAAE